VLVAILVDANAGIFTQGALFSDQVNHASIIDGVRLAKWSSTDTTIEVRPGCHSQDDF